jgi:hypothetical protein
VWGRPMRVGTIKILAAALALTVMAASAQAQVGGFGGPGGGGGRQAFDKRNQKANEPAKPKADDKAYNSALKTLPDKQYDAWHGVR